MLQSYPEQDKKINIVKGFIYERQFFFYCNFCLQFHTHGIGSETEPSLGFRSPHCVNPHSPYLGGEYKLKEFSYEELKRIKKYVQ